MTMNSVIEILLLVIPVLFPILCGLFIIAGRKSSGSKPAVFAALVLQCGFVVLAWLFGAKRLVVWQFTKTVPVLLKVDEVSMLFTGLLTVIWLLVGIYSFEYMKQEDGKLHEEAHTKSLPGKVFYGFYLMVLGVMTGIGFSGNLVTLYLFYEFMTLLSVPLVIHTMTKEAVFAAKKYLFYSVAGASLALFGFAILFSLSGGNLEFAAGGIFPDGVPAKEQWKLLTAAILLILGFGTKAGMFPMHGWLPSAHPVAPAPASAVLSGVITKAGVIGIVRSVFYLIGAQNLRGTWVQTAFLTLSLLTVFMGSMLAYKEQNFKKRLAYSTVSQVSYVLFGLATLHPVGFVGAMLHLVFHSIMKTTLFLNAGAVIYETGKTRVEELTAIGSRMPVTMWTFTIASLGLIGIPPFCGFASKWYLGIGALDAPIGVARYLGPAVLLLSALLTAGYLLSITIRAFFPGEDVLRPERKEANWRMLVPMLLLAAAIVLLGIFPGGPASWIFTFAAKIL